MCREVIHVVRTVGLLDAKFDGIEFLDQYG
jgi:hypothetical protein